MPNNNVKHTFISYSIKGINKEFNEDNYLSVETDYYYVFAVFDGIGSARNSKLATSYAKEFIENCHFSYLRNGAHLDHLMYDCNQYILGQDLPEAYTTYCIVAVCKDESHRVALSHMGDSRIYMITNQYIDQLTLDDKLPTANIVTKCLGMNTLDFYDFRQKSLNITDENLLLCTDGFYHFLEEDRMQFFEIMNKKSLKVIKDSLVGLVEDRNKDDATFLLIR